MMDERTGLALRQHTLGHLRTALTMGSPPPTLIPSAAGPPTTLAGVDSKGTVWPQFPRAVYGRWRRFWRMTQDQFAVRDHRV